MSDVPRYGKAKMSTVRRDFLRLRDAIKKHDPLATEEAWDKCERWLWLDVPPVTSIPASPGPDKTTA